MLAAPCSSCPQAVRNPGKWVVEWIHHPEDETVEGLHLGKAKLFDQVTGRGQAIACGQGEQVAPTMLRSSQPGQSVHSRGNGLSSPCRGMTRPCTRCVIRQQSPCGCQGTGADLLQGQFQMWHISRLDPYKLAAGQINGQVIASGYQHLQISFISIKWPFTILSHAAIDDGEGWFDAQVHIHYALIDAKGMHGAPIRAWQYAHGILHTERHN